MLNRKQLVLLVGVAALTSALVSTAVWPQTTRMTPDNAAAKSPLTWMFASGLQDQMSGMGMR